MKQCAKCQTDKLTTAFYANPNTHDKIGAYCKECQKAVSNRHDPKYHKESEYFTWDENNATI
jgi:hypothetical protein